MCMSTDRHLPLANEKPGIRGQQVQRGIKPDNLLEIISIFLYTALKNTQEFVLVMTTSQWLFVF